MAHIKEPAGVDFIIQSEPLTKEEKVAISEYIRNYKAAHSSKPSTNKKAEHTRKKSLV